MISETCKRSSSACSLIFYFRKTCNTARSTAFACNNYSLFICNIYRWKFSRICLQLEN